jgi:hypothetical protein
MTANWSKAAQEYQAAEEAQKREEENRIAQRVHSQVLKDEAYQRKLTEIDRGTAELVQFMLTEGPAAMELLRASKRHIIFGEVNEGGGFGSVYFIDGNGLQEAYQAMGMWIAYSKDVPRPRLSTITEREAVEAAVQHGGKKATEVVTWLRGVLDKIASAAPTTK